MARTDPTTVKATFDTDLSDSAVSDWISRAGHLVDDIANEDPDVSDSRLADIETLVAQHFAAAQDQRLASGDRESASVEFQGQTWQDFRGTKYGQNAIALDPTGVLLDTSVKRNTDRYVSSTGEE